MPRTELQYPKKPFSTVKRLNDRANYELETIHKLINEARIVNVSFNDPDTPFPVVLPMIGVMGSFDRPSADIGDPLDLYLHGYVSSRVVNLTRKSTTTTEGEPQKEPAGLPMTISTSTITGLVLALTPNHHSYNYTSATVFGHATHVTDTAEKLYAMELITNKIIPTRWTNSRTPPTSAEMTSTSILKVKIQAGSAKISSGGPKDDRHDLEDQELKKRVWTGVVPVYTVLGEPVPGGYNEVGEVPGYLSEFVKGENEECKRVAEEAARVDRVGKLLD